MNFNQFLKGEERKKDDVQTRELPEDIRYALRYKGFLNRTDIETLVKNNFINEALYLTFKSLTSSPDQHRALLEKYISCILKSGDDSESQKKVLQKVISESLAGRDDIAVKGVKLTQLSRQGFDLWQEKFKSLATKLSGDERNTFLLAHATFLGLKKFLQAFSKKGKTLNVLVPEWIKNQKFGYAISLKDGQINIDWLHLPFDNTKGSILVDDTENTGKTLEGLQTFLTANGSQNPEIMVIAKTP